MKIGIVTVHDSNNYGSFLQAYALKIVLEGYGHEVYFSRTRDKKLLKSIFVPKILQKKLLKHPIQVISDRKIGKEKRRAFLKDQEVFNEIDAEDLKKMDVVILGSDEIWNTQVPAFQTGIFYGAGLEKLIAYAVSVGRAEKEDIFLYEEIVRNIRRIPDIMVRDMQTQKIVEDITGERFEIVCDPTFLVDPSVFKAESRKRAVCDSAYLLIYSYSIGEELKLKVKKFAEENNLKIVSACFKYQWADYNVMCGPLEFCEIIAKASYVITMTFHGTIFSVLNEKQFISFPASIKTDDLLLRLGLQDRIMNFEVSDQEMSKCLKQNRIDYAKVNKVIADFRDASLMLLQNSIQKYGE